MNVVMDEAFEEISSSERKALGLVVRPFPSFCVFRWLTADAKMIRGNSITMIEALERVA